jgi:alkylation response protein AidB-like acyl-CoA dehydrogenase
VEGKEIRKGGSFLWEGTPPQEVFTCEDFTEEHKLVIKTVEDFIENEVLPHMEEIEHKNFELSLKLMRKAGELGFLGADIDEEHGGALLDKIGSLLISEYMSPGASFALTMGAHTGIGTMPIVFFGTKYQKEKYLPYLASGEKIGAYALTEPGAGSDAMSIVTRAILSDDGKHYSLCGEKQFITNAAFADIIIVYAKVDCDKFTAFIVERDFKGISIGEEEKKMGIRGSSTASVILDEVKVPVENVLFEVGKGHTVAFNILDLGRFKLGGGAVGAAKKTIEIAVKYAKERMQFGKPICHFGLIKHKLAEMAIKTYMAESMVYRTGGLIDKIVSAIDASAEDAGRQSAKGISEYSLECSISKVYGSETLDYVADEALQIHGGYGYIEEYPAEQIYRDSRINRIFEGTNEINRLIIPGVLFRKGLKGEIPFLSVVQELFGELPTIEPVSSSAKDGSLGYQKRLVDMAKKIALWTAGVAGQKYGKEIIEEQEILGLLSEIIIETYVMESGLLRALKAIESSGEEKAKTKINMVRVYVQSAMKRIDDYASQVFAAMEKGDALHTQLEVLSKLSRVIPTNTVEAKRNIADRIIEAERYIC